MGLLGAYDDSDEDDNAPSILAQQDAAASAAQKSAVGDSISSGTSTTLSVLKRGVPKRLAFASASEKRSKTRVLRRRVPDRKKKPK